MPASNSKRLACSTSRSPLSDKSTSVQPVNVALRFHVDSPCLTSTNFPGFGGLNRSRAHATVKRFSRWPSSNLYPSSSVKVFFSLRKGVGLRKMWLIWRACAAATSRRAVVRCMVFGLRRRRLAQLFSSYFC